MTEGFQIITKTNTIGNNLEGKPSGRFEYKSLPGAYIYDSGSEEERSKTAAIFLLDKEEVIILLEGNGLEDLGLNKYEIIGGFIHEQFPGNPQVIKVISDAIKNRSRCSVIEVQGRNYEISITYTYKNRIKLSGIIAVVFETPPPMEKVQKQIETEGIQQLFEKSPDSIVILDSEDNIACVNTGFTSLFGFAREDVIGKNIYELIQPEHLRVEIREIKNTISECGIVQIDTQRAKNGGVEFDVSLTAYDIGINGSKTGSIHIYKDITDRKENEESIRTALMEKEMLLKETHHRVKNNLQIVSSLLLLQTKVLKDKDTINVILESQNRVKSISLIHEKLYQSKNLSRIDFDRYLNSFIPHLFQTFGKTNGDITFKIKAGNIFLNTDTAIPCGLIINEIVSNSLKYAFAKEQKGEIKIELIYHTDNSVTLIISDNGIGLPEKVDLKNPDKLGLQIVTLLVRQLNGTIELINGKGTKFKIKFPLTENIKKA